MAEHPCFNASVTLWLALVSKSSGKSVLARTAKVPLRVLGTAAGVQTGEEDKGERCCKILVAADSQKTTDSKLLETIRIKNQSLLLPILFRHYYHFTALIFV